VLDSDNDDDVLKLCRLLSPVQKLAAILAAVSHDVDHPGVSPTFLTTTDNPLASIYTVRTCSTVGLTDHLLYRDVRPWSNTQNTYNFNNLSHEMPHRGQPPCRGGGALHR